MGVRDTYKRWPKWARIAAPVTAGLIAIGAASGGDDDKPKVDEVATSTTFAEVDLSDAAGIVSTARKAAGLSAAQAEDLVKATCDAAVDDDPDALGADVVAETGPTVSPTVLGVLLERLGDAAEAYCPDDVAGAPKLLDEAYDVAQASMATTTSSTTTTTAPTTTIAPGAVTPTTAAAPTTRPPSATTTTARPTTTAPPPTAPPTTPAPTTTQPPPQNYVTPGAFCGSPGATGVTSTGVPMTCSTAKCDGTPYDQPRWRKTTC
jgi:hypothetical protein